MERKQNSSHEHTLQEAAMLKTMMLKQSTKSGLNLYDHLTRLLIKMMDEQPQDAVDVIEDISRDLKRALFEDKQSTLRDLPHTTAAELLAEQQLHLFHQPEDSDQEDELEGYPLPNLNETGFYLEQAGAGLCREEMQMIFLALKQLVESQELLRCRLWGKILGLESNYIVAETESREGEEEEDQISEEKESEAETQEHDENEMDPLPQSKYKPPRVLPKEPVGTGVNKFVYYVCNVPGLPWVKLPSVSPVQIVVARQIPKFFTGKLDSPINSYPPFPGNEANYLRAQIARISATTQVSPRGFFQTVEEESDEEDEETRDSYEVNPDFECIPAAKMAQSLSNWVHHVKHILPQGRCTWMNMTAEQEDSIEEGEAEEKEEDADEPEHEDGPPLLTSLSQDEEIFSTPPWSSRLSSNRIPQYAIAVLHSNLWPGAIAYACEKKFDNIYIGWGLKYVGEGYSPPVPPQPQTEYPSGPEITEALDPTPEEELALKETLEEEQAAQEELEDTDGEDEDDD